MKIVIIVVILVIGKLYAKSQRWTEKMMFKSFVARLHSRCKNE